MLTLETQARDSKESLDMLRAQGRVPAVYYGAGKDAISVSLDHKDAITIYKEAGQSTLINLKTQEGLITVLLHDLQVDAVSQKLLHMDFLIVDVSKPITVSVALHFIGESPAEKQGLGLLTKSLHEIEIEVLPAHLPSHLDVDLSRIVTLDDNIFAKDIVLPESAQLMIDGDITVASVSTAKEEFTADNVMDLDSIVVDDKGKKSKEKEEGDEGDKK